VRADTANCTVTLPPQAPAAAKQCKNGNYAPADPCLTCIKPCTGGKCIGIGNALRRALASAPSPRATAISPMARRAWSQAGPRAGPRIRPRIGPKTWPRAGPGLGLGLGLGPGLGPSLGQGLESGSGLRPSLAESDDEGLPPV
jgi:hypothetical protein